MKGAAAVFLFLAIFGQYVSCADTRIRIIHTNDMHARFEQTSQLSGKCSDSDAMAGKCYGGFPRTITAVKEQRRLAEATGYPLLFLNGGDFYQGTVWYSVFKWEVVAQFVNRLGLDAMSLGNHEFDDYATGLAPFLKNVTAPVVACNVGFEDEPELASAGVKPSIVISRGGLQIGVIGYITPETTTLSQPGKVKFYDEITRISEEAAKLKDSGVNIVIALGHSGYDKDMEIARSVPDVDIVVGAHSHSFLYTGAPPDSEIPVGPYPTMITQPSGRKVPVVQAYAFTKYLGVFDVYIDDKGEIVNATGRPLLLDSSVDEDKETLQELEKWKKLLDEEIQEKIALTRVLLNGTCRFSECNLGNLVTDAFVDYSVRNVGDSNWTSAAISLYSGGGIRASIDSHDGTLTREVVIVVLPFYNALQLISLQGKYLLEALEWSVTRYDPNFVVGKGEFLQMSGIHVTFDVRRPVGSRVVNAKVRCSKCSYPKYEDVHPDAIYNLVTTAFIANGGDNFTMIADNKELILQFESLDTDIVTEFIQRQGLVYDGIEERITFIDSSSSKGISSGSMSLPTSIIIIVLSMMTLSAS